MNEAAGELLRPWETTRKPFVFKALRP